MHYEKAVRQTAYAKTKRVGYLYEKICDLNNIKKAIWKASEKKRHQRNIRKILKNIKDCAKKIQTMLLKQNYHPSPYILKTINDGIQHKKRNIAKPRFYPDQCIHHALIQVLEPYIMRGMYFYCCGSVPGRGDKRIRKAVKRLIVRRPQKAKYVLKMDVRHFYESIDHSELKKIVAKKIKDKRVLWLCDVIIDSYAPGIPIGNYTSQWFCNLFLEDLDHKIKAFLGKGYSYYRYVDDMVILGANKRALHRCCQMINAELAKKKLEMKGNWQLFRLKSRKADKALQAFLETPTREKWRAYKKQCRALDFVGCRFFPDGHVELRKSILKRVKRKARKVERLGESINAKNASGMMAYMGRIHSTNSENLFRTEIGPRIGSTKKLRRIISHERKLQRKTAGNLAGSAE